VYSFYARSNEYATSRTTPIKEMLKKALVDDIIEYANNYFYSIGWSGPQEYEIGEKLYKFFRMLFSPLTLLQKVEDGSYGPAYGWLGITEDGAHESTAFWDFVNFNSFGDALQVPDPPRYMDFKYDEFVTYRLFELFFKQYGETIKSNFEDRDKSEYYKLFNPITLTESSREDFKYDQIFMDWIITKNSTLGGLKVSSANLPNFEDLTDSEKEQMGSVSTIEDIDYGFWYYNTGLVEKQLQDEEPDPDDDDGGETTAGVGLATDIGKAQNQFAKIFGKDPTAIGASDIALDPSTPNPTVIGSFSREDGDYQYYKFEPSLRKNIRNIINSKDLQSEFARYLAVDFESDIMGLSEDEATRKRFYCFWSSIISDTISQRAMFDYTMYEELKGIVSDTASATEANTLNIDTENCDLPFNVESEEGDICNPYAEYPLLDWKQLYNEAFENKRVCEYHVSVVTGESEVGDANFSSYKTKAVEILLDFVGKEASSTNKAIAKNLAQQREFHIPARGNIQVLFTFTQSDIDNLKNPEDDASTAPTVEERESATFGKVSFKFEDMQFLLMNLSNGLLAFSFQKALGSAPPSLNYERIQFLKLRKRFGTFAKQLKVFMRKNDFPFNPVFAGKVKNIKQVDFYLDATDKPNKISLRKVVIIRDGCPDKILRKELGQFRSKSNIEQLTIANLFKNMETIVYELGTPTPLDWIGFVKSYYRPLPGKKGITNDIKEKRNTNSDEKCKIDLIGKLGVNGIVNDFTKGIMKEIPNVFLSEFANQLCLTDEELERQIAAQERNRENKIREYCASDAWYNKFMVKLFVEGKGDWETKCAGKTPPSREEEEQEDINNGWCEVLAIILFIIECVMKGLTPEDTLKAFIISHLKQLNARQYGLIYRRMGPLGRNEINNILNQMDAPQAIFALDRTSEGVALDISRNINTASNLFGEWVDVGGKFVEDSIKDAFIYSLESGAFKLETAASWLSPQALGFGASQIMTVITDSFKDHGEECAPIKDFKKLIKEITKSLKSAVPCDEKEFYKPEIKFNNLKFEDLTSQAIDKARDALEKVIYQVLKTITKKILANMTDITCDLISATATATADAFAGNDLKEALYNAFCGGDDNGSTGTTLNELLDAVGAWDGYTSPTDECISIFVDIMASSLSNDQMKNVLRGEGEDKVINFLYQSLENNELTCLTDIFKTPQELADALALLGSLMDPALIDAAMPTSVASSPLDSAICSNPGTFDAYTAAQEAMMAESGASPEQIAEQVAREKEARKETLQLMFDIMTSGGDSIFSTIPSLSPEDGEESILPSMDPQVEFRMKETINNMSQMIEISLMNDLGGPKGYLNNLLADLEGRPYGKSNFGKASNKVIFLPPFPPIITSAMTDEARKTKAVDTEELMESLGIDPDEDYDEGTEKHIIKKAIESTTDANYKHSIPENVALPLQENLAKLYEDIESGKSTPVNLIWERDNNIKMVLKFRNLDSVEDPETIEFVYETAANGIDSNAYRILISKTNDTEADLTKYTGTKTPKIPEDLCLGYVYREQCDFLEDATTAKVFEDTAPPRIFSDLIANCYYARYAGVEDTETGLYNYESSDTNKVKDFRSYLENDVYRYILNFYMGKNIKNIADNDNAFKHGYDTETQAIEVTMDPEEVGKGTHRRPPYYIAEPQAPGWFGIRQLMVPSPWKECSNPMFGFSDIADKAAEFMKVNIDDPRANIPYDCMSTTSPYTRKIDKYTSTLMESTLNLIVKFYLVRRIIHGMPALTMYSCENGVETFFDDILYRYLSEKLVKDIQEDGHNYKFLGADPTPRVTEVNYYYNFIEMIAQNYTRKAASFNTPLTDEEREAKEWIQENVNIDWKNNVDPMIAAKNPKVFPLKAKEKIREEFYNDYMSRSVEKAGVFLDKYTRDQLDILLKDVSKTLNPGINRIESLFLGNKDWIHGSLFEGGPNHVPVSTADVSPYSEFEFPEYENNEEEEKGRSHSPFVFEKYYYVEWLDDTTLPDSGSISEFYDSLDREKHEGVVNISELRDKIEAYLETADDDFNPRLKTLFKSISVGVRIVLMLEDNDILDSLDGGSDISDPDMVARESKAYKIGTDTDIFRTVPVIVEEKQVNSLVKIRDFAPEAYFQLEKNCLIGNMIETDNYRFFVDYVLQMKTMLSLCTVYVMESFNHSLPDQAPTREQDTTLINLRYKISNWFGYNNWERDGSYDNTAEALRETFLKLYNMENQNYGVDESYGRRRERSRRRLGIDLFKIGKPRLGSLNPWWKKRLRQKLPCEDD